MAETTWSVDRLAVAATRADSPRHAALVRVTHWLTTVCFLALLVSGLEIVVSHPRFYWGESGNVLTPALFSTPDSRVPRHRPDRVWLRAAGPERLEPLSAFPGGVDAGADRRAVCHLGRVSGHFRKELLPDAGDRSLQALSRALAQHLRFARPDAADAWSYNLVQRLTYILVIFVLFPLVIWTGLAMSPAFVSALPSTVTFLGGRQSARTLHFLVTLSLVAFLLVHVAMVWFAGFGARVMAMITGAPAPTRGPE